MSGEGGRGGEVPSQMSELSLPTAAGGRYEWVLIGNAPFMFSRKEEEEGISAKEEKVHSGVTPDRGREKH